MSYSLNKDHGFSTINDLLFEGDFVDDKREGKGHCVSKTRDDYMVIM